MRYPQYEIKRTELVKYLQKQKLTQKQIENSTAMSVAIVKAYGTDISKKLQEEITKSKKYL